MLFTVVLQALFFFLPAYVANAVPVFLSRFRIWEFLNVPVDFHYRFREEYLIGSTKTYRGIVGGILGAMFIVSIQSLLYFSVPPIRFLYLFPYIFPQMLLLGCLQGLGEGFGDVVKSFFKRRFRVPSTGFFFPFDQMSFLGALLLGMFVFLPPWQHVVAIIILSPGIPVIANIVAYKCGWKKVWW